MTSEELERLRIVIEDLVYLRDDWNQDVDDSSLRRTSPVLRRLLVEGDLARAWRSMGFTKQSLIEAPSLEAALRGIPFQRVRYAQAGGANYRGMQVQTPLEVNFTLSLDQMREMHASGRPVRTFSLRRFMESLAVVARGTQVQRETIIKYIANKLGGAHLDVRRNPSKEIEKQYSLLDEIRKSYIVADKSSIYFELLSIGQSVTASSDVDLFITAAQNALPSHGA